MAVGILPYVAGARDVMVTGRDNSRYSVGLPGWVAFIGGLLADLGIEALGALIF